MGSVFSWWKVSKNLSHLSELIVVYFMLLLVSGAKMQLPLQLGVTDRQTNRLNDYCNPLCMRAEG